jgi:uncharacterized coiled-coil DUF342 family protein
VNTRAEKILALQEKSGATQAQLEKLEQQSKEMAKETAGLREKYVTLQIERDNLIMELTSARNKLAEVQSKLSQIGSISQTPRQTQEAQDRARSRSGKSVDVELMAEEPGESANVR